MMGQEKYSKALSELRGITPRFKPGQRIYDEITKSHEVEFRLKECRL